MAVRAEGLFSLAPEGDVSDDARQTPNSLAPLVLLTGVALALRCAVLEGQPLWYDEINTLYRADAGNLTGLLARLAADVQAPLFDLGLGLIVPWAGTGPWVARLPAALCGALLVPVVAGLVGLLGGGRGARLTAAAWVALDPYLVRYGVECRPYALLALASGATLWSALALVSSGGRRVLPLALAGSALVASHHYGAPAFLAVLLWVLLRVGDWRPRGGAVLAALALPPLVLLAWSPVALHQVSARSMGDIYRAVDLALLRDVWDGLCLAAPLAVEGPTWALAVLRVLVALLVLTGLARLARGAGGSTDRSAGGSIEASPASGEAVGPGERRVWRALAVLGLAVLVACLVLDADRLAGLASRLVKQGRPLDGDNLAFLDRLLVIGRLVGGVLLGMGLVGRRLLDGLARLAWRPGPGWLLLGVLVVPLAVAGALAATGQRTLAARNLILAVPAVVALASVGLAGLPRSARPLLALVLLAGAGLSASRYPDFLVRRDWPAVAEALRAEGDPVPLAHPPWIARCLEHALGREWGSVAGSYRPDEVLALGRGAGPVALVSAYHELRDPAPVRQALVAERGRPRRLAVTRGVLVEIFPAP